MSTNAVLSKPNRPKAIIPGMLGCLVLCFCIGSSIVWWYGFAVPSTASTVLPPVRSVVSSTPPKADQLQQTQTQSASSPTLIATIPIGEPAFDVALNPNTNRIYVYSGGVEARNLSIIAGDTNGIIATISVGFCGAVGVRSSLFSSGRASAISDGHCIAVNPSTNRIYVISNGNVLVFDGDHGTKLATVSVGFLLNAIAINPNTNTIYAVDGSNEKLWVINGSSNNVIGTIAIFSEAYKIWIGVNPKTNRVYVPFHQSIGDCTTVIDGNRNAKIGSTMFSGCDRFGFSDVAINPNTNRMYLTNGNSVYIIDLDKDPSSTNPTFLSPKCGAQAIAVNPNTNRIYLSKICDSVSVVDGNTNTEVATVQVGRFPTGIAINPSTNRIYVSNLGDKTISVIFDPPSK